MQRASNNCINGKAWDDILRRTMCHGNYSSFKRLSSYETQEELHEQADFDYWLRSFFLESHDEALVDSLFVRKGYFSSLSSLETLLPSLEILTESYRARAEIDVRDHQANSPIVSRAMDARAGATWFDAMVVNMTTGLRLFRTSSGSLGKGLPAVQNGDVVLLIAGVSVSMTACSAGKTYKLIGLSYVYGMMYGEKWPDDENDLIDLLIS